MVIQDILYVALSTIVVMVVLQITTFFVTRMLYPPEPKIVYRDVPVMQQQQYAPQPPPQVAYVPQVPQVPQLVTQQQAPPVVFTQPPQEVQLPEYEPRKPASTSLRMDTELPPGIQETRPPGA
jgi:hypothetical protein